MNPPQASGGGPESLAAAPVRALAPYVIGKPIGELAREIGMAEERIVKLASNENPLGPSPLALEAMRAALADTWLYPDGNGHDLKVALAAKHGVSPAQITLGNGSNDLIVLLAETFLTTEMNSVYAAHAFAMWPIAVQATGARSKIVPAYPAGHSMPYGHDLDAMLAAVDAATRAVYIASPNNPTGTWNTPAQLRAFLEKVPVTTIVVLDEAYFEYAQRVEYPDGTVLLGEFPNLVVLRTFSKAHALAGVRVGYAVSHPGIADLLNRVRQPFNVGIPGLVGATVSLGDASQTRRAVALVEEGLVQLGAELPRLGLKVHPTAGNFVLADVGGNAQLVYERLLRQGVIVRPVAGYGLPHCLRITIGTAEQNERLIAALAAVLRA